MRPEQVALYRRALNLSKKSFAEKVFLFLIRLIPDAELRRRLRFKMRARISERALEQIRPFLKNV